jgi:hypothetical protein
MIGMAFHNGIFLRKKVEYFLMPFYGFNNSFAGYGKLTWNLIPFAGNSRQISFSLEGSRFGAPGNQSFNKIKTGVEVYFKEKQSSGSFRHMVYGNYIAASNLEQILNGTKASTQSFYQVGYAVEKNTLVNPLNLTVDLEQSSSWLKTSFTANYLLSYYGIDKGLNFRFFAGKMFGNIPANSLYNLAPSGRAGREEYLYSGTFPDRFAQFPGNFWSRQMFLDEGGLITPINHLPGYSDWLFSLSVNSDLPGKFDLIPVKPFMNLLINDHNISSSSDFPFFYEAGIKAGVWNLFEIYFPFLVSNNLSQMAPTLHERIRFIFNLNFLLNLRKNRKA